MTALQIAENVAAASGFEIPTTLTARTGSARTLLALMNRGCRVLATKRGSFGETWPELTREHAFTTVAGQEYYPLPQGFSNLLTDTVWDRTTYWPATGPLSPQEWSAIKGSLTSTTALAPRYRIVFDVDRDERAIRLDPVPGEGEILAFEYLSTLWARESAAAPITLDAIAADSHVPIFPAHLVELDLDWRVRQSQGRDYRATVAEFELQRDRLFSQAVGLRTLSLDSGGLGEQGLANPTIREGSWNI